ncbi:MAG TPA: sigma-70 family RNA polymerase sigma factor [Candidatus Sulfomarinibacteraceae bacterium]|nr:sigma-70 family RNA polymerase sigma factor [Candidatus Sulfomarinibacteraceae bacterium]
MTREKLWILPCPARDRTEVPVDDRELVRAARRGDEDAFADLVRRHSGGLHRSVARVVLDDAEAWDVVQMAFIRAWQRLDRYNPQWSFATWLYRIGANLAIDLVRSRTSRLKAHKAGGEHQLRVVGGSEQAPSDRLGHDEVDGILRELVEELTPQQRTAFVLREIDGLETSEVAEILGCSVATVRNHVFQARKTLRREVERRFPEYVPEDHRGGHEL